MAVRSGVQKLEDINKRLSLLLCPCDSHFFSDTLRNVRLVFVKCVPGADQFQANIGTNHLRYDWLIRTSAGKPLTLPYRKPYTNGVVPFISRLNKYPRFKAVASIVCDKLRQASSITHHPAEYNETHTLWRIRAAMG